MIKPIILVLIALIITTPAHAIVETTAYQLQGCETLGAPPSVYVTITSYSKNKNEIPHLVIAADNNYTAIHWLGNPYQTPTINSWDAMVVGLDGVWVINAYVTIPPRKHFKRINRRC